MKKDSIASKFEKSWTVLLVDGKGRVRRIRNFRQKLWAIAGISAGALIVAAVMGVLYGGMVQKQMALSEEADALREEIAVLQQQNELLKVRAVRVEAQAGKTAPSAASTPPPAAPSTAAPAADEAGDTAPSAPALPATAAPPPVVEVPASATPEKKPEQKPEPRVDVEGLKVAYQTDTETIEAQFIIKNTGQGPAGGRAVVVLHTEEGQSALRFALPSVQLRDGRPIGNRGRRFSISRFMTLKLDRKFAEPGTRFTSAMVFAYSLEGKLLLEKEFDVALDIPEKKAPATTATNPEPSENSDTTVAPLGLSLPEPKPESEETKGTQP